ncbi:hypothetical protein B5807_01533 [Epicoccum nigrum]|uniref:Uncharacterized protein n=1 Tax=Epicoccum nigrum TaxID=105696 RepID=A0A1Y2MDM1_EPING|nr:hypothetical protein B5807_01533 [Epicoccum nigrum]
MYTLSLFNFLLIYPLFLWSLSHKVVKPAYPTSCIYTAGVCLHDVGLRLPPTESFTLISFYYIYIYILPVCALSSRINNDIISSHLHHDSPQDTLPKDPGGLSTFSLTS